MTDCLHASACVVAEIVFSHLDSVMSVKQSLLFSAIFLITFSGLSARMDIRALEDVEPGMRGVWKTVVEGTGIESFELEILGTAPNFIGPQEPIILAKVLDPENVLSGPVAGMSGSPVYIEGQLVGAYAYGYTWPKEQGIIGITPIERMLPLLSEELSPGLAEASAAASRPSRALRESAAEGRADGLEPLPTPLAISGISPATFAVFQPKLERWGLEPMRAPSGGVDLRS